MSAPSNAITVGEETRTQWENPNSEVLDLEAVCLCGWSGQLRDLLCDPGDPSPESMVTCASFWFNFIPRFSNDFWCPNCKTKAWYWK